MDLRHVKNKSWRYWAWLAVKIGGATGVTALLYALLQGTLFRIDSINREFRVVQFTFDGVLLGFWILPMVWIGLVWLCLRDQRFRCPVCARKLRMPVGQGSYGAMLLDHPGTEYVCPYGHGKLLVQVWISADDGPTWTRYGSFWEELFRSK
jgi:hypothetical protein